MAAKPENRVKLTETDFLILSVLQDGRNIPANIALDVDRARNYINQRMPYLLDYGLVEKIGPYKDSGLYELTDRGRLAYDHRAEYHDDDVDFDDLLDELAADES